MSIDTVSITSLMTTNVKTARANQTIREVCKNMHEHRIGSIVILQGNSSAFATEKPGEELHKPVGIITERDVVSYLGSDRALSLRTQISEIMSTPLITIGSTNSLRDAIEIMQLRNIRRLPVIGKENSNEKMVGIVTDKDILRAIIKTMPSSPSATEGVLSDQMRFEYQFMYERFINEDHFSKDTHPGIR